MVSSLGDSFQPMTGRRQAILEAVWQLMAQQGPGGVSVRSVAAVAGTSPGAVQHHFPTRDALIREAASLMIDTAHELHTTQYADRPEAERLTDLLGHAIPRAAGSGRLAAFHSFVVAAAADPELAQILAEAKRGQIGAVAELLPVTEDRERTAARLVALADGLALAVSIGQSDEAQAHHELAVALAEIDGPA